MKWGSGNAYNWSARPTSIPGEPSSYRAPLVSSGLKSAGVWRASPGEVVVPVEMLPVDSCVCNEPLAHEFVC